MRVLNLNHADIISAITNGKSYGVLHVLFNKFHHLRLLQRWNPEKKKQAKVRVSSNVSRENKKTRKQDE